jgi:hypothetical protein
MAKGNDKRKVDGQVKTVSEEYNVSSNPNMTFNEREQNKTTK